MDIFALLPDQLFATNEAINNMLLCNEIVLIEDSKYFTPTAKKSYLVFLRANMKYYEDWLEKIADGFESTGAIKKKPKITYVSRNRLGEGKNAFDYLKSRNKLVNMFRLSSIHNYGDQPWEESYGGIGIRFYESPGFITTYRDARDNYKSGVKYNYAKFKEKLLSKYNISKTMLSAPSMSIYDDIRDFSKSHIGDVLYRAAVQYVGKHFKHANGKCVRMPIGHIEAEGVIHNISHNSRNKTTFGFYRNIAPLLDIGLLNPDFLISLTKYGGRYFRRYILDNLANREYIRVIYFANPDVLSGKNPGSLDKKILYDARVNIQSIVANTMNQGIPMNLNEISRLIGASKKCGIDNPHIVAVLNDNAMWGNSWAWTFYMLSRK